MNVYKNSQANIVYPFIQSVPFPMGWVQDVKLALKTSASSVFISSIGTTNNGFFIQLQTPQTYIGYFQTQQEWLSIDNQVAFGFVKFGGMPQNTAAQKFSGKWELYKGCYTLPVNIQGISQVAVNGMPIALSQNNVLQLQLTGDLTQRQSNEQNVANIGRDADSHTDYNAVDNSIQAQVGILTVNGISTKKLILVSQDQSWLHIDPVIEVLKDGGNYVLYLTSAKTFQGCDPSDSQTYYPPEQV